MGPLNLVLWIGGAVLVAVGYRRGRGPWARYQALKAQDENIARYDAWRGGIRDSGQTGASVAMEILRRQARLGALVAGLGIVLIVAGSGVRGPRLSAAQPPVLDRRAAVHHDEQPRLVGDASGLPVGDAKLQPQ